MKRYRGGTGAVMRMPANLNASAAEVQDGVAVVLSLQFEAYSRRKIRKVHASFYLRLNNLPVDRITQIVVWYPLGRRRTDTG